MKKLMMAWLSGVLIVGSCYGQTRASRPSRTVDPSVGSAGAPLLFCIGLHIEPFGATVSQLAGRDGKQSGARKGDYTDERFFNRHVNDIRSMAAVVAPSHTAACR